MLPNVALLNATSKHYVNVYVVGDFNAHIDWSNNEAPSPSDAADDYLLEIVHGAGLTQLAQEASYTAKSGRTAFLDLAFATNASLVHSCQLSPSLLGLDHSALTVDILQHLPKYGRFAKTVQLFHKMDLLHLQQLVHLAPWTMALSEESPTDIYAVWLDFMTAIQKECLPTRPSSLRHLWITHDIVKLCRRKKKLFHKAKLIGNPSHLSRAKDLQRELKRLIYVSQDRYVQPVAAKASQCPKLFWAYVNSQRKSKPAPQFSTQDAVITDPQSIANLFSRHFSQTQTADPTPPTAPTGSQASPPSTQFDMTAITPDTTLHALHSINPYQAAGLDGITPAVLKASVPQIAPVLASMFSRFLIMGRSP
ncbi:hypothetical protein HPB47_018224 [Ixodes persulcatus]|uniref:Uncharacterized protein n=1 Tax=Ixodes persulcatus TaxID=34615 RepID=A0AC60QPX8_IXOPE|nr:hypothetical protein HPB47_018224 [Ixodes persulcatus]